MLIKFKWIFNAILMLLLTTISYPLSLVLPIFAIKRVGYLDNNTRWGESYYLPNWLSWFQTPDNSLDGDEGWRTQHWQWRYKLPTIIAAYIGRVGWIQRNPAYGFGLVPVFDLLNQPIIESGNSSIELDANHTVGSYYVQCGDHFQYRSISKVFNFGIYLNLGWNIKGTVAEIKHNSIISGKYCTFAFTIKFFKF